MECDLYWPANVNGKKKRNIFPEFRNQIISATLKTRIAKKQGSVAKNLAILQNQ
jgi:hypothetical protein